MLKLYLTSGELTFVVSFQNVSRDREKIFDNVQNDKLFYCGTLMYLCLACLVKFLLFCAFLLFATCIVNKDKYIM